MANINKRRTVQKWITIISVGALSGALSAFVTVKLFIKPPQTRFVSVIANPLIKGEIPGPLKDCQDVFDKYCKEIEPGNGRIIKCLNAHEDQQNTLCKMALKKISDISKKENIHE
ncbi:MAG: cysteine rich repeat-containing protein [Bdellovibrio sp.]